MRSANSGQDMEVSKSWDESSDIKLAGEETQTSIVVKRKEICSECPSLNEKINVCREWGCFMPFKIRMGGAVSCPLGKW